MERPPVHGGLSYLCWVVGLGACGERLGLVVPVLNTEGRSWAKWFLQTEVGGLAATGVTIRASYVMPGDVRSVIASLNPASAELQPAFSLGAASATDALASTMVAARKSVAIVLFM